MKKNTNLKVLTPQQSGLPSNKFQYMRIDKSLEIRRNNPKNTSGLKAPKVNFNDNFSQAKGNLITQMPRPGTNSNNPLAQSNNAKLGNRYTSSVSPNNKKM